MTLNRWEGVEPLQKSLKDKIFDYLMNLQKWEIQLRINHWQTDSYAEHKATDTAIGGIHSFVDALGESAMGEFGRPKINTNHITISDRNITSTKWVLESIKTETSEILSELKTTEYEGLLALVGDFDAELKKYLYLITLG